VASDPSSSTGFPLPVIQDAPPGATVLALDEERPLLEPLLLASPQGVLVLEPVPPCATMHEKSKRNLLMSFDAALLSERMRFTSLNKGCRTAEAANTDAIWTVCLFAALVRTGRSMFNEVMNPAMDPEMPNGSMTMPSPAAASVTKDLAWSSLQLE
jgi:hypothetical protein